MQRLTYTLCFLYLFEIPLLDIPALPFVIIIIVTKMIRTPHKLGTNDVSHV